MDHREAYRAFGDIEGRTYESLVGAGKSLGYHELPEPVKRTAARELHWQYHMREQDLWALLDIDYSQTGEWLRWGEILYRCDECDDVVQVQFECLEAWRVSKIGAVTCRKCNAARRQAAADAAWKSKRAADKAMEDANRSLRAVGLRALPYDEYLKTDHWQQVRQEAHKRDGGRCRVCNSPENLNVHHRTYERLGEELPDDVTTLCQPCHEMFHANLKLARPE